MPKAHDTQTPAPSDPVDPALQAHTFEVEPVMAEIFPTPHPVHEAYPGSVLSVPKVHDTQTPAPSDPVNLALQAHTFVVEPVTAENFPVPHLVHTADPGSVL